MMTELYNRIIARLDEMELLRERRERDEYFAEDEAPLILSALRNQVEWLYKRREELLEVIDDQLRAIARELGVGND